MQKKLKIGITIGDINGIGLEVILKSLSNASILQDCIAIVYGQAKIASYHKKNLKINDYQFNIINHPDQAVAGKANLINCWEEEVKIELGKTTETGGKYAVISLQKATNDLLEGKIDAIVTAPINKDNVQSESFNFPGHTEFFESKNPGKKALMFMLSEGIKIGVVTGHVPLKDVSAHITKANILQKLVLMNESLKKDFWIEKPKIAILGLNPHAGDNGLLGSEEQEIISPAIQEAFDKGIICFGPYPADGFFGNESYKQFDGVLAMYHDQGLVPFKTLSFGGGINFTAGLDFIRTSPDHGTGYGIAGKDLANPSSFIQAIYAAIHITNSRREQEEMLANQLKSGGKIVETQFDLKDDAS